MTNELTPDEAVTVAAFGLDKPASYIDEVAPTPHWGDENITMDALVRARLAEAQRMYEWNHHHLHLTFELKRGDESVEAQLARAVMMKSLLGFLWSATEAHLLMEVQRLAPDTADVFAAAFVSQGESGDYYPEMLWDWLTDRGIDPEKIREEAAAQIAEEAVA